MKEIKVQGFKSDTTPDDRPAVCVFGDWNVGKTRFSTTMPHANGAIGIIPLDKNTMRTLDEQRKQHKLPLLVPSEPFITAKDEIEIAMLDSTTPADRDKVKHKYTERIKRIFDFGMRLATHPDVESIAVDASQLFDFILFSHFGRRNQIDSFLRGAPNQDMIDFVNALRFKNVCWVHRAAEVWKDSGEVDNQGKSKQKPTGKFKPDGCSKILGSMTVTMELTALKKRGLELDTKYGVTILSCKGNTLLEGQKLDEYGVVGEEINWANIMTVIGVE